MPDKFRSRRLSAWEQYQLLKVADPVIPAVVALSSSSEVSSLSEVPRVLQALASAEPSSTDQLFRLCLESSEVWVDGAWSPVDPDLGFQELLKLVVSFVHDNLGDYLSHRRFRPEGSAYSAPQHRQVGMPDGSDWFWRPLDDHMCSYESLVDGRLRLVDVARMNDVIAVREENTRLHAEWLSKQQPGR